ncbi:MAG: ATP-binding protein [Tissierellales bacterium]|nr:ATP-binding protein [Tissierellales bacterium]
MIKRNPVIGKYMLDSISIGMYNHPLMLFREYIQNSVDSIDEICCSKPTTKEKSKIDVKLNGRDRFISITDNGSGIKSDKVWETLFNIGKSEKFRIVNRGFRGIGRLGGLGYCDRLTFKTKATDENILSIVSWNSKKLRRLINEYDLNTTAVDIIKDVTEFSQEKYKGSVNDHFFIVELENVKSIKDICLDVPELKSYLSQIAPVPFNYDEFRFSKEIENELFKRVPSYGIYNIYVNGEKIYKPYRDIININSKINDQIAYIDFVDLGDNSEDLAFGWIAGLQLLGSINNSNLYGGVRIRSGNILVGNKNLLSTYYREERFSNYLVGEIHVTNGKLILNSRRDDFEDNEHKEIFYNNFIKKIGIPYSRKIRDASERRSKNKNTGKKNIIFEIAENIVKYGYLTILQKNRIIEELKQIEAEKNEIEKSEIDHIINEVTSSKNFLDKKFKIKKKELLKDLIETLYKNIKMQEKFELEIYSKMK